MGLVTNMIDFKGTTMISTPLSSRRPGVRGVSGVLMGAGLVAATMLAMPPTTASAQDRTQPTAAPPGESHDPFSGLKGELPEWMSRIRGTFEYDDNTGATYELETIQPLWQHPDKIHTIFGQGRVAGNPGDEDGDDDVTLNFGVGYRYLLPSGDAMFGANTFYDRTVEHGHQRIGFGAETFLRHGTLRFNWYEAFSDSKVISRSGGITTREYALDGFDIDVEAMVPYMPWARLGGGYYLWEGEVGDDTDGFQARLEMDLTSMTSVEVGGRVDDVDDSVFVRLRVPLGPAADIEYTAIDDFVTTEALPGRDLRNHTLAFVERHNDIVVETVTSGSGGLAVTRSD